MTEKKLRARKANAMDTQIAELKRKGDEVLDHAKKLHREAEVLEAEGYALHDAAQSVANVNEQMRRRSKKKQPA